MDELTVDHLITDLGMNLERLRSIVEEVSQAIADGNLNWGGFGARYAEREDWSLR